MASPALVALTASQREVLELLYEYAFLTPRLLALAYGSRAGREGRGYWHIQRVLRTLFDAGLVHRFPRTVRAAQAGSSEAIHAISHTGGRAVLDPLEYSRLRHELYQRGDAGRANFEHHLAVATLQLVVTLGQSGWRLIDFRAEDRDPSACVRVRIKNSVVTAWPDAYAVIESNGSAGTGPRTRYLFEIDLTRKNNQRVADRFLAYATFLTERSSGRPAGTPTSGRAESWSVVFAVTAESELERFIELAGTVLSAWKPGERPTFLFWNIADWYGPTKELRSPSAILRESRLATIDGGSRRLVEDRRA